MPQKVLRFTGINRRVNEFQNSGACEELINLRPEIGGGHSVVKPKHVTKNAVSYDELHEHSFGSVYNQIAITNGRVEWINLSNGGAITITGEFEGKNVYVSYAGNVLLVYCEDDKKQLVFKFEDGEYRLYDVAIKPIRMVEINYGYDSSAPASNTAIADDSSVAACDAAMQKAASGFYGKFPNGLCGAAVVGCTYELDDGSETWSTAFVVANVAREYGYVAPTIDGSLKATVTGASSVNLRLEFDDVSSVNIKKINIYSSRPVFQYVVENLGGENHRIRETTLEDAGLDSQLMYYQGSIIPDSTYKTFKLNFGKELAGDSIMDVNAGCVERTGMSKSYNNRFHYYRSEVQHVIQAPTVAHLAGARDDVTSWVPFVLLNGEWKRVNQSYKFSGTLANDFIYPMAGVERLAFIETGTSESSIITSFSNMFYVGLKDSSAYNYSFAFDVTPELTTVGDLYDELSSSGQHIGGTYDTKVFWKDEVNTINVSAPFNPFVFPVEHSYGFGGEVIDVVTSYMPISSTQVGQYPLSVFTSGGIYALEQGNGEVLYSNVTPIQPLVMEGKATATPYGAFFVSSKNLYLLSGRESVNVSYVLEGERELTLRELDSYKKLCCNEYGKFFNFDPVLSKKDLEEFLVDATLVYDQMRNELHIGSGDSGIPYSYVLNMDTRSFHKVIGRYLPNQNGSRYAIEQIGEGRNVIDLHNEEHIDDQPILLQSRPMSLEAAFTHIRRLVMLADAVLDKRNQSLCLSVFASDNLHDWKCVISSQKSDVALRQISTNRAAKSYRDYVILITGTVDTHTDISDIIADYSIVNRRIG